MATNEIEDPIHGDILEAIFSHVPLIHLVPARHVSNSWKRAVSNSLRHVSPVKPWLTVHTQSPRAPHVTTSHAYDPRSRSWIQIHAPPSSNPSSPLRSSHSTLIYTLSPTGLSFSLDPLGLTWHHAPPPRVWRVDPVVARVGGCIIVAGGACDFEDDPLAVEMYEAGSRAWFRCESMPEILKGSTASTWLSVAVAGGRVYVTEKNSGVTYSFDSETKAWLGPYELRPEEGVFYCVTGTVRGRLMVAGLVGDAENVKGVELWEVKGELGIGSRYWCEELGVMPKEMVAKMKGDDGCGGVMASISVTAVGDFVYLVNPWVPEEMVVCEFAKRGGCGAWGSVRNEAAAQMERMVFCGGYVGVEDLESAVAQKNCKFALR